MGGSSRVERTREKMKSVTVGVVFPPHLSRQEGRLELSAARRAHLLGQKLDLSTHSPREGGPERPLLPRSWGRFPRRLM